MEMIGADERVIRAAEDREEFRKISIASAPNIPKAKWFVTCNRGWTPQSPSAFPLSYVPITRSEAVGRYSLLARRVRKMIAHA